eukprot:2087967-Ditylum_brightwellii.AAC.1
MEIEGVQDLQNEGTVSDALVFMTSTDVSTEPTHLGTDTISAAKNVTCMFEKNVTPGVLPVAGSPVLTAPTLPEKLAPTEFCAEILCKGTNSNDSKENSLQHAIDCVDFLDTIELKSDNSSFEVKIESCGDNLV